MVMIYYETIIGDFEGVGGVPIFHPIPVSGTHSIALIIRPGKVIFCKGFGAE
jgi:hypothetical protein